MFSLIYRPQAYEEVSGGQFMVVLLSLTEIHDHTLRLM